MRIDFQTRKKKRDVKKVMADDEAKPKAMPGKKAKLKVD